MGAFKGALKGTLIGTHMGALLGAFREPHTLRTAKAIIPLSCEATAGGGGAELIREFTRVLSVFLQGLCRVL